MRIGQLAAASGVSAKTIRHYEAIGLLPKPDRLDSNYRHYVAADVGRLGFVRRARGLGFSLSRIRDLLALRDDAARHSADVKAIALSHVADLDAAIGRMRAMADELRALAGACEGDDRPECPIMRGLAGVAPSPRARGIRAARGPNRPIDATG